MFTRSFFFLALLAFSAAALCGQANTGTIVGTVRDSSGATVPGATVTVNNQDTQVSSTWASNEQGDYAALFLLPGAYEVTVDRQGFKKTVRKDIVVQVADKVRVDFQMQVGSVSETVTVSEAAPLLQSESSEVGQVIQDRPITDLPLNSSTGRNFTALMTLIPGTLRTNPVGIFDSPQGNSSFIVNGLRDGANNYMVDGADNNEMLLGIVTVLPPPDAIGEFKVQTSAYSAEFGRAGGAVVNVQTRSGSNVFHGSLYEFLRNSAADARTPFDASVLPPLRQNEFGGTVGGPIRRNKTFFFFDLVEFRQRAGATLPATVPTANQVNGVFLTAEGAPKIYDPFTKLAYPNNTMPASSINTVGLALLKRFPAPNLPGTVVANQGITNNYTGVSVQEQDSTRFDVRIDHTLTAKDALFGRYSFFQAYSALPPLFYGANLGPAATPSRAGKGDSRNQNAVIGDVHTFSPNKINEVRLAASRIALAFTGYDDGQNTAAALGIPNLNVFGRISSGLPIVSVQGLTTMGTDAPIPALRYELTMQLADNFTYIHGRHTVKFGADLHRNREDFFQISLGSPRGSFTFDPNYTSGGGLANSGLGVASALLGFPSAESRGVINIFPSNVTFQSFVYVQDDFRVTPKLTLNFGLRYELFPPVVDRKDNQSNFDPKTGQALLAGRSGNSRALVESDLNNFDPRFGFAYSVNRKWVVRGGYGLSGFPDKFGATGGTLNNNYPFITLQSVTPPDRFLPTSSLLINTGIPIPVYPDLNAKSLPITGNMTYFDPKYRIPYIQFWNLTVQHQLPGNWVVEAGWVGTKGTHLFGNNHVQLNQPAPGPGNINTRRPYALLAPALVNVPLRDSSESSIYHSLQTKVEKRLSRGFFLLSSYTWSKSIDDAATKTDLTNWRGTTRAASSTDFTHALTTSGLYDLPFGRGRRFGSNINKVADAFLGGWQTNGIYTFRTGTPVNVTLSAAQVAAILNNGGGARPDLIAPTELPKDQRTLAAYFNTAAFVAPPNNSYRFGNSGRNAVRGPSFSNLDFSLFKSFKIVERYTLQFRSEFFNILNHPNFGNPSGAFGTANIGRITSVAANPRNSQFALRLTF